MSRYKFQILNGNILKIIALITMTVDHVGMIMFPDDPVWRYIGRLAFPIFAYMIAEGCYYTKNKKRYVGLIFAVGVLCQIVTYATQKSLYMCIMITFTLSVLIIFSLQKAIPDRNRKNGTSFSILWLFVTLILIAFAAFLTLVVTKLFPGSAYNNFLRQMNYHIDYGFAGILLPVIVYIPNLFMRTKGALHRVIQSLFLCLWIFPLWKMTTKIEWMAVFAVIPLLLYNGERGRLNLKYLFYIYYPAHLGIIYMISSIKF